MILPIELKNRGLIGIGKCKLKGHTFISQNPASRKPSCGITARFSWTILKFRIECGWEYWTCGQEHDPGNWNWKPWQHLERLCRKQGLDGFAVRDILVEHLGRKEAGLRVSGPI